MDCKDVALMFASGDVLVESARNRKSDVWAYFELLKCKESDKYIPFVKCIRCDEIIRHAKGASTSNLKRHKCVKLHQREEDGSNTRAFKKIKTCCPDSIKKNCVQKLVMLCSKDLRSFNIVTGDGFRKYTQFCLQAGATLGVNAVADLDIEEFLPDPTTVSRNTQKLTSEERSMLVEKVKNVIANGK